MSLCLFKSGIVRVMSEYAIVPLTEARRLQLGRPVYMDDDFAYYDCYPEDKVTYQSASGVRFVAVDAEPAKRDCPEECISIWIFQQIDLLKNQPNM